MLEPRSKAVAKAVTQVKAIDQKKDKILYAGLALLAGILAIAAISSSASAKVIKAWAPHGLSEDGAKVPFQLGGQRLSH